MDVWGDLEIWECRSGPKMSKEMTPFGMGQSSPSGNPKKRAGKPNGEAAGGVQRNRDLGAPLGGPKKRATLGTRKKTHRKKKTPIPAGGPSLGKKGGKFFWGKTPPGGGKKPPKRKKKNPRDAGRERRRPRGVKRR